MFEITPPPEHFSIHITHRPQISKLSSSPTQVPLLPLAFDLTGISNLLTFYIPATFCLHFPPFSAWVLWPIISVTSYMSSNLLFLPCDSTWSDKIFFFLRCHLSSCTQQLSTREKNTKNNWYYCKFTFMTFNWSQYYLEILQWFFFHEPILYNDVFKPPFSSNLCSLYPQFFGGKLCLLFIKEVDPICGSSFGFSRITNLLSCTHLLCLPSYCNGQIPLL